MFDPRVAEPPRVSGALEVLREADALLQRSGARLHTLDPRRAAPSTLASIGERLIDRRADPPLAEGFARALGRVAAAQLEHFPDNLFWDFDYLAATIWRAGAGLSDGPRLFSERADAFCELCALFGRHSAIRFRYAHDFAYGFDWQRWVRADPAHNSAIGPFEPAFLHRVLERGREILTAIARGDDEIFPPLPEGVFRNPFAFSRAPEHELILHRELAARGALPVTAFEIDALPDWQHDATALRANLARTLQLPPR